MNKFNNNNDDPTRAVEMLELTITSLVIIAVLYSIIDLVVQL